MAYTGGRFAPHTVKIDRSTTGIPSFVDGAALEGRAERGARHDRGRPGSTRARAGSPGSSACCRSSSSAGCLIWMIRRQAGGGIGGIDRSRARLATPGVDEAKAELSEIGDYLRHPEKYRALGGRVPHGVLLTGPPGHREDALGARPRR